MRALSNPEFVQFMADNANMVAGLQPGQSIVVNWGGGVSYGTWGGGMPILVYIGPLPIQNSDGSTSPDIYLTDVSNAPQLAAIAGPGYGTTPPQTMLDTLPQAMIDTIKDDAATAGALVNQAGQAISAAAAAAAAGLKSSVNSVLTPLLIGAVIVFGLLYLPKGRA
jgi:hypothetical protein